MKQWTPRCSQQIKEMYHNLPKERKGNALLEQRLNALYEQFRHKRKEDRSNLLQKLFSLRSQVKPEIPEGKAKHQVNFKLSRENGKKIEYLRKEGFTDSKLFEVLVLMETSLKISSIKPSVERKKKEAVEIAEAKELEAQPAEKGLSHYEIYKKSPKEMEQEILKSGSWIKEKPDKDRNEWRYIRKYLCRKDQLGSAWGKRLHSLEEAYYWASLKNRMQKITEEKEKEKLEKREQIKEETPQILVKPELSIEEIVDQLGVCENPIIMREKTLLCHLCEKQRPQKWEACQEIQKELTMPVVSYRLMNLLTFKLREKKELRENPYWWWQASKTENMSLEEIEKELGLRSNLPSYEDVKFDAIRKRYEQICVNCEEHLKHECTKYCREFLNGLDSVQNLST